MRNREFNCYSVIWGILFVLFNVIAIFFGGVFNFSKVSGSFLVGYFFINLSLILQYVCTYYVFIKSNNLRNLFYNFSIINYSYTGLIVSFIVGILCMLDVMITYWVAVIVSAIVLAFYAILVFKSIIAVDEVVLIDDEIVRKTKFIKTLMVEVEVLMNKSMNSEIKDECKKLYEIVRYSDPMYSEELIDIENEIKLKFSMFSDLVNCENVDDVKRVGRELLNMIDERNKKCKLFK